MWPNSRNQVFHIIQIFFFVWIKIPNMCLEQKDDLQKNNFCSIKSLLNHGTREPSRLGPRPVVSRDVCFQWDFHMAKKGQGDNSRSDNSTTSSWIPKTCVKNIWKHLVDSWCWCLTHLTSNSISTELWKNVYRYIIYIYTHKLHNFHKIWTSAPKWQRECIATSKH